MQLEKINKGNFELCIGQLVKSKCGRDKDRIFIIKDIIKDYVLLVDGDLRKIEKPKLKKNKHISKINMIIKQFDILIDTITNKEIREIIKNYKGDSING